MAAKRMNALDLIRGFSVLCMVVYHGVFSLIYLFHLPWYWFRSAMLSRVLVPAFAGVFILISGICSRFSHSSCKRGIKVLALGMLMSLVTAVVTPKLIIRFGILHLLGISMILCGVLHPLLDRIPWKTGFFTFLILFVIFYHLPDGYLGIGVLRRYLRTTLPYLYPLGLPAPQFYSSDYYPLIPWFFMFCIGRFLGAYIQKEQSPQWLYPSRIPSVE